MAKATKQTKKYASSGKLKQTIEKRRKFKQIKKKNEGRDAAKLRKERKGKERHVDDDVTDDDEEDDDEVDLENEVEDVNEGPKGNKGKGKASAGLVPEGDEDEDDEDLSDFDQDDVISDDGLDDAEADAAAMAKSLAELQQKDPEFYKYLQENDADLLDFGAEDAEPSGSKSKVSKATKGKKVAEEADDEDDEMEYDAGSDEDEEEPDFDEDAVEEAPKVEKISVTMNMLRGWQRAMIEQRSLRSLRRTVLAFRAAAHMNEEEVEDTLPTKYIVESSLVFNKLVLTSLKFTPVVLAKHMPYKVNAHGRFKVSAPPASQDNLPRFILSHFNTIMYFIKSLPSTPSANDDDDSQGLLQTAITESTKLLPWVIDGKKQIKAYLKLLLDLWSSAGDNVRIAAFLAVRKVYVAGDESIKDLCLKNIYSALLPPLRLTSAHTLPSLNLMKNSAAELYQLNPNLSYQHAFGYIRMLAVHLRSVVRGGQGDKDAFRAVYNWQFVHCIDFWSRVLAGACDKDKVIEDGGLASPLEPLIYPLVQIALGAIRLVPTSRFFPLRFHVLHSLLRLVAKTGTYIPLAPYCLEILESAEFKRSKHKAASLRPLDLEYIIRAPASYPKTRIYQESLAEELVFVLGEFHALMGRHIAFPEMTIPVIAALKRHLKRGGGSSKSNSHIKTLVEKIEATRTWVEKRRQNVDFAPNNRTEVESFLEGTPVEATPIGTWMRLQRKVRDQKRKEIEMAQRQERGADDDDAESDDDDEVDEDEEMDGDSE